MTPATRVVDVDHVRFRAPDLDRMERFLTDFGLTRAARTETALYMRGTDPAHHVHVTELGDPGFASVAFRVDSPAALAAAAATEGASGVEEIDEPGGGARVRWTDPDGFRVEVVHGIASLPPLPVRRMTPFNAGSAHPRKGALVRVERGPAQVKRLGHVVVRVADFRKSEDWYKSRFGFLSSDEVYLGDRDNVVTAFLRCDRGAEYVDHHTFLCAAFGAPGFEHAAFEVEGLDDVMVGHEHLVEKGWQHSAGVGRHVLGSQVYDYWKDPWGHTVEHFCDGDLLNADHAPGLHDPGAALGSQWGAPPVPGDP